MHAGPITRFRGDHFFLSNFSASQVAYDGVMYPTVEHAYQAAKTCDPNAREWVRQATTAGEAKKRGQKVPMRSDWMGIRVSVMYWIVRSKFKDPTLARLLLQTGSCLLIEGNFHGDTFWGQCKGIGENHLGKILMQIRLELQLWGFVTTTSQ